MNRPTEHISYGPGKFEGESCIARFAHWHTMNGFSDPMDCDCEETLTEANNGEYNEDWDCAQDCASRVQYVSGPFTIQDIINWETDIGLAQDAYDNDERMCLPCVATLLELDHVDVQESDSGFIYASA